jgi:peptide chain release factor 3
MAMEKERGISMTSTVLQFEYDGTMCQHARHAGPPGLQRGHLPHAGRRRRRRHAHRRGQGRRGPQTEKLFRVCKLRGIPIFTFVNKMDRHGRDPLDLMEELENHLGMPACPMNWPVFDGAQFVGVYERRSREIHVFDAEDHGSTSHRREGREL